MPSKRLSLALALAAAAVPVAAATPSNAAPLHLTEVEALHDALVCRDLCDAARPGLVEECRDACPALAPSWEKSGDTNLDMADYELALLELWDGGDLTRICYRDEAVVPAPLCGDCLEHHSQAECEDADGDGLVRWQEDRLGTSDEVDDAGQPVDAQVACRDDSVCDFASTCRYEPDAGISLCRPRACAATGCTAFHLELIAANDSEVIIQVHYDHSPVPATVLDLRLDYDPRALALVDARPLRILRRRSKQLTLTHPSANELRLVVLGIGSTAAVPTGPIIELVFRRTSEIASSVGFTTLDHLQRRSLAPAQGELQEALTDDAIWGEPITLGAVGDATPRLLLSYSFDGPRPLDYKNVPSADELCSLVGDCNAASGRDQTKLLAMMRELQNGAVGGGATIDGVQGSGMYLDGVANHLALPVTLNRPYQKDAQGFSLATWFYAEGPAPTELADSPQLLFSHNTHSEKTRFGVLLQPAGADAVNLVAFDGDYAAASGTRYVSIARALPLRTWTHLGVAVDAATGELAFYLNGELAQRMVLAHSASVVSCPGLDEVAAPEANTNIRLHKQGDVAGAKAPDVIYFAARESGLFGIERMDVAGTNRRDILRDGEFTYQDPHYSPIVDKLVYSSNAEGDFEIFVANGDGSDPQRITDGFGDTERKIFARRPRWAPDASAILFESNAFGATSGDNADDRGYQVYYIGYDPEANQVDVPLPDGINHDVILSYGDRDRDGSIHDYRITDATGNRTGVVWLRGKHETDAGPFLGEVLLTASDERFADSTILRGRIRTNLAEAIDWEPLASSGGYDSELRLFDAHWRAVSVPGASSEITSHAFYEESWAEYHSTSQLDYRITENGDTVTVTVRHTPSGYDEMCWDSNRNRVGDSAEDRNRDGVYDRADCYPAAVRNLYLAFDNEVASADLENSGPGAVVEDAAGKELELREAGIPGEVQIWIEVQSPESDEPIPAGGEIAQVVFRRSLTGDLGFALRERVRHQSLFVKDLVNTGRAAVEYALVDRVLDEVDGATFGPDGETLVLSGVTRARPAIIRTKSLLSTSNAERISTLPMRVEGLSWTRQERYYPCEWVGGYRDPRTQRFRAGFRGGLDELRVYSYAREARAFRSDAQRGHERLVHEGRDGPVASRLPTCPGGRDSECPAYHQCVDFACRLVACDPADPYACDGRGLCSLRPEAVEDEHGDEYRWVCASECSGDGECFSTECTNGPCRFCDGGTATCAECRHRTDDYGSFQISYIEGCPDRSGFDCVAGSCVTECYRFESGESVYLCDPVLESCYQGRCVMNVWDWNDLSPMTLAGMGEARYEDGAYTVARSQLYPIEIAAHGVEDYLHPPELLVEGRVSAGGAPVYDRRWFRIGRVLVYNKTPDQADNAHYILYTPYPIDGLRLRLITPPYENLNAASTGLGAKDKDFCRARADAWAAETGAPVDYTACTRRASGSRFTLGYRAGIPAYESYRACADHGGANCPSLVNDAETRGYLYGGQPAVVISDLKVNGGGVMGGLISNTICSYEDSLVPSDAGRPKKVIFGDAVREQSNQREAACSGATAPAWCDSDEGLRSFKAEARRTGNVLLNCNFHDEGGDGGTAGAVFTFWPPAEGILPGRTAIHEDGNSCRFEDSAGEIESCYEYVGHQVSMDPLNAEGEIFRTLDINDFTSFGYDAD